MSLPQVVPASVEDPPPVAHRPTPTRSAQYINADIKEVIKTGYHNGGMGEKGDAVLMHGSSSPWAYAQILHCPRIASLYSKSGYVVHELNICICICLCKSLHCDCMQTSWLCLLQWHALPPGAQIFHLHDRDLNQTKKDMDAHLDVTHSPPRAMLLAWQPATARIRFMCPAIFVLCVPCLLHAPSLCPLSMPAPPQAINAARDARRAKKKHAAVVEWHKAQKQVTKRALPMVQNLAKRYKSKHWKQVWGAFEHRRELGASPAREREHLVHPGEERTGNNGAQGIPRAIQPKVVTDPDAETVEDAVKKSVIKTAEVKTAAEQKSNAVPAAEVQVAASASKQVKMIPAVQLDQELRKEKVLRERMELYKQNDEELVQILKMHSIDVPPGLMP